MINIDTELRKLRPADFYNLALILNPSDNWKKLMASVTKEGTDNIPKFPGEYISIVEHAARQERKLAGVIFLEEWATMGKKRPTVGLLLDLLIKTQLLRAADYLSKDILKVAAPQRPASGPAAPVDVDAIAEMLLRQNLKPDSSSNNSDDRKRTTNEIRLSQINYPSDVFDSTNDDDSAVEVNQVGVIEMQYAESRSNQVLEATRISNNRKSSKNSHQRDAEIIHEIESKSSKEISDLIKFSANDHEYLNQYSQSDLIKFDSEKIEPNEEIESSEAVIPNISLLLINSSLKKDLKEKANYAEALNAELTSLELPAGLEQFGNSRESSVSVDETAERDNEFYDRELVSADVPLFVNNRMGVNSEEADSSAVSSESIDDQTSESLEIESEEYMDSMSNIPCFVVDAERNRHAEKRENLQQEKLLNSLELPITVVEFHNR